LEFSSNPSKSPLDKGDFKKDQERLFRGQIAVALKHKKPLIIHSRKASDETLAILGSYKNLRGVIHCYTGGKKRIQKVLDLPGEWYFGIDGNLTYEDGLVEVVNNIPKDRLLLETDCPALTPIPHRGEINYPEYVKFVYEKVAEIWGMSFEETEKIIDGNAKRLFGI
jgi:TatD DNase family protein